MFSLVPLTPGYRARLIDGMLTALSERSYVEVSVMDIVRHAKVSKRTFYEHFPDKERCFLETYSAVSAELLARIAAGAAGGGTAEDKLSRGISAYIGALEEHRSLVRAFLSEVHAAGPLALAKRRDILQRFAELLRVMVESVRAERPDVRALSSDMAMTVIGGIHELLLLTLERDQRDELAKVGETAYELITAIVRGDTPVVVAPPARPVRAVRAVSAE